jgi:hypothetical protein
MGCLLDDPSRIVAVILLLTSFPHTHCSSICVISQPIVLQVGLWNSVLRLVVVGIVGRNDVEDPIVYDEFGGSGCVFAAFAFCIR